jgi:hypothetical protein
MRISEEMDAELERIEGDNTGARPMLSGSSDHRERSQP